MIADIGVEWYRQGSLQAFEMLRSHAAWASQKRDQDQDQDQDLSMVKAKLTLLRHAPRGAVGEVAVNRAIARGVWAASAVTVSALTPSPQSSICEGSLCSLDISPYPDSVSKSPYTATAHYTNARLSPEKENLIVGVESPIQNRSYVREREKSYSPIPLSRPPASSNIDLHRGTEAAQGVPPSIDTSRRKFDRLRNRGNRLLSTVLHNS